MSRVARLTVCLLVFLGFFGVVSPTVAQEASITASGTIVRYDIASGLPSRYPRALTWTSTGEIIAAFMAESGVNQWLGAATLNPASATGHLLTTRGLESLHVTSLAASGTTVLATTERGLYRLEPDAWRRIGPSWHWQSLAPDDDGAFWVAGRDPQGRLAVGRM
ncbi:MAG TPA: hypothetical protein PKO06_03000, partial [Candidatus Ozemobacteraceae bacterium]|nr:hypothetical protein [Candidatus Ozemobacteraceae bacterium]